ncbi:MAG: Rpn family recombination-promoting nuclease/putative transposase [Treponema sp.]|nr:Rpn family recombination-promoting nuclease/putative transposase [Treponema sp.]
MTKITNKSFHILNPRLDPNFKAIFTQNTQASKIALKSFLSAAIGRDVKEATVIQNEDAAFYKFQRSVDYDINCEFADGTKAQVEMQGFDQQYDYGKRAEYYAARLVSSVMEVGDDWNSVAQAYQISVLDFVFDKSNSTPVHHYQMADLGDGARLSGRLNVIFLELPKLPKVLTPDEVKNLPRLIKWCKFLKEADNPKSQDLIRAIVESEEGIMKASDTLKNISDDGWRWVIQGQIEGKKRDYTSGLLAAERRGLAQGIKEGLEKGIEQGLVQGMHQNAIDTARKFLAEGISPEMIAKCCSLSLEEVLKLNTES